VNIYLTIQPGCVVVQARADGDGMLGDLIDEVSAGERFGELTYETLLRAGSGQHDYEQLLNHQQIDRTQSDEDKETAE